METSPARELIPNCETFTTPVVSASERYKYNVCGVLYLFVVEVCQVSPNRPI